jgi:uncharacterized protein
MEQEEQHRPSGDPERTWGLFCHLGALSMYIGVPFGNILVPLIIWLVKKDEMRRVDEHGKAALNFQISFTIYAVLAGIAFVTLVLVSLIVTDGDVVPGPLILLAPLLVVFFILAHIALTISATIKAGAGELYRYPLAIRFFR